MASLTVENYVKAIYMATSPDGSPPAATGQLASMLRVSPGTVSTMLRTLSESGLVSYAPYEGVRLTPAGNLLALRVIRRHRLIELFLVKTLNLSWDEVHEEAENMEHAVSDALVERIETFLGYPAFDPHGDPIPRADGSVESHPARSLSDYGDGETFRVARVLDQSAEFLRYLTEIGLGLGAQGSVRSNHAASGIITVSAGGPAITLSRERASRILVSQG